MVTHVESQWTDNVIRNEFDVLASFSQNQKVRTSSERGIVLITSTLLRVSEIERDEKKNNKVGTYYDLRLRANVSTIVDSYLADLKETNVVLVRDEKLLCDWQNGTARRNASGNPFRSVTNYKSVMTVCGWLHNLQEVQLFTQLYCGLY